MPFIHLYSRSGRDLETKKKIAQAIVKAASEAMGAPENVFDFAYQDVEVDDWAKEVDQGVLEPNRDIVLIEKGKLI